MRCRTVSTGSVNRRSATGKLMEGVLAAFAQFDNDVRSDRTKAGMQSALALGRWTFLAPIGYLNAPRQFGTSLMPDPERAPLVRQAFEEFATGRFTKREVLANVTRLGLRTRRGAVVSAQTFDSILENALYAGIVDVPAYGVRDVRGDFEPLIDEATFHKVQAVLSGRISITSPRERNRPDFPLRGFVRCESCGRLLTASWSNGRSDRYAYYHCRGGKCRAVNVTKTQLEGLFAEELERLQPTEGYMRLLKDTVLQVWRDRRQRFAPKWSRSSGRSPRFGKGSTSSTMRFCSRRPSTSRPTIATVNGCAESSHLLRLTGTRRSWKSSTSRASSPSRNAPCRARRTCGFRRRSISGNAFSSCSFLRGSGLTGRGLFEPG
jgi:hypothetical protein